LSARRICIPSSFYKRAMRSRRRSRGPRCRTPGTGSSLQTFRAPAASLLSAGEESTCAVSPGRIRSRYPHPRSQYDHAPRDVGDGETTTLQDSASRFPNSESVSRGRYRRGRIRAAPRYANCFKLWFCIAFAGTGVFLSRSQPRGIYGGDDGTRNSALVVGCANSGDYSAVVVSGPLTDND
jgi:hypothetical protein